MWLAAIAGRFWNALAVHSANQRLDHCATKLTELLEAAGVIVGPLVVIESEQSQQRDVQATDVMHFFHSGHAEFIRRADRVPRVVDSIAANTGARRLIE